MTMKGRAGSPCVILNAELQAPYHDWAAVAHRTFSAENHEGRDSRVTSDGARTCGRRRTLEEKSMRIAPIKSQK
jgi:hypothetical protein